MGTLCCPWDRRYEGKRACVDEDSFCRDTLLSVRSDNAYGVCIDKRCLSIDDDGTCACCLRVVLLSQHCRQESFLRNRCTIALRLCRKVSARLCREPRTVFEGF